jgi:peroxiredoxin/predicted 2-oxoglutarate/Fe(II)-dependent dioxygenase YbiX
MLTPNDPAPWFTVRSTVNPKFRFDIAGGRYLVLCFFGSAGSPGVRRVLDEVAQNRDRFDTENAVFFGISTDPDDERLGRVRQEGRGIIFFWDFDFAVSRLYGASSPDGSRYQRFTVVLDPALRTVAVLPLDAGHDAHVPQLLRVLDSLPPIRTLTGFAPILMVPGVFERNFCRALIVLYEQHGGQETGVLTDVDGKTESVMDYKQKRRSDYNIADEHIIRAAQGCIQRRIIPEIQKAFQFKVTCSERYAVACYDALSGGYFRPHRDNTTTGTAHRRFALSINLNAHEYEGGELRFPEFGSRTYRAATGEAIVFSCALLHEVTPVTTGKRYAFLPFLYNEEADRIRQHNLQFVAGGATGQAKS